MKKALVTWTNEEKEDLATRIIIALSEEQSIGIGIKSFLDEFPHNGRTVGTCYWMWSKELKKTHRDEIERMGIVVPESKSKRKPQVNTTQEVPNVDSPTNDSPIFEPTDDTKVTEFFSVFEKMIGYMKTIYNENVKLKAENEALRGQLYARDETLAKATEELNTFIKAFQIARPKVFGESVPSIITEVNNRGEIEKIKISG